MQNIAQAAPARSAGTAPGASACVLGHVLRDASSARKSALDGARLPRNAHTQTSALHRKPEVCENGRVKSIRSRVNVLAQSRQALSN